jgi:hypothetical protein
MCFMNRYLISRLILLVAMSASAFAQTGDSLCESLIQTKVSTPNFLVMPVLQACLSPCESSKSKIANSSLVSRGLATIAKPFIKNPLDRPITDTFANLRLSLNFPENRGKSDKNKHATYDVDCSHGLEVPFPTNPNCGIKCQNMNPLSIAEVDDAGSICGLEDKTDYTSVPQFYGITQVTPDGVMHLRHIYPGCTLPGRAVEPASFDLYCHTTDGHLPTAADFNSVQGDAGAEASFILKFAMKNQPDFCDLHPHNDGCRNASYCRGSPDVPYCSDSEAF